MQRPCRPLQERQPISWCQQSCSIKMRNGNLPFKRFSFVWGHVQQKMVVYVRWARRHGWNKTKMYSTEKEEAARPVFTRMTNKKNIISARSMFAVCDNIWKMCFCPLLCRMRDLWLDYGITNASSCQDGYFFPPLYLICSSLLSSCNAIVP